MNFTINDLVRLRWSLIFLALAIAAAVAVVIVSRQMVGQAENTQQQLLAQQREIHTRIARAREEEQDIRNRITRYQQLRDHGVIGLEERLDWVEQIARIRNNRRLIDVQYELSPQKAIDDGVLPGGAVAGSHEIMASNMRLRMQLLHENDLLGFLDDLRRTVHAHLLVRECLVERTAGAPAERGLPAQLSADCMIDWVTIRERRS
jgi:hypothetical protein